MSPSESEFDELKRKNETKDDIITHMTTDQEELLKKILKLQGDHGKILKLQQGEAKQHPELQENILKLQSGYVEGKQYQELQA